MNSNSSPQRFILDTCSVRVATEEQLLLLQRRGEVILPPHAGYELLHQVLGGRPLPVREAIGRVLKADVVVGPEAVDLMRAAFAVQPHTGARHSPSHLRMLLKWAAERGPGGLAQVWEDLWRRGLVAHGPFHVPEWKDKLGDEFLSQMAGMAGRERKLAKDGVSEVISKAVAKGRAPPARKIRRAMEGRVHDTLLESFWPSIRLLHYVADAAGLEVVTPESHDDPDGCKTLAELCRRYGYVGGLEFAMRAYTFMGDRFIFGHNGHRNDLVDMLITLSVSRPFDVLVTEENWWRHYVGMRDVASVAEVAVDQQSLTL